MSLLDRVREAQDEPARQRSSPWVGPSILSVDQLRAMERALAREMPGFAERAEPQYVEPLSIEPLSIEPLSIEPLSIEPLSIEPPAAEPLPIWVPPVFEPVAERESCPRCDEAVDVDRIDLTTNARWLSGRSCGMRWGGSIDRPGSRLTSRERGHIAAG
jgi:hypothetical protein